MIELGRITTIDISKYVPIKLSNETFETKTLLMFSGYRGSGKSTIGLQMYNYWFNHDNLVPMKVEVEEYVE